jgi:hypothetical protein
MRDDQDIIEDDFDLRNDKWYVDNFDLLMERYPGEWIAVSEGKIMATDTTKSEVENNAEKSCDGERYSIYFMTRTLF